MIEPEKHLKQFPYGPLNHRWLDEPATLMGEPLVMVDKFPLGLKIYVSMWAVAACSILLYVIYCKIMGKPL